ncbi:MgtC/SapB family protein [Pseudoflavitalea sp. X16]|uniref:MgtC/SapB family protein n=1 Tax=Paraflavitalea devenefica TaxID=2716334 RepID=UPI00141E1742|nr:MgtC/SapB family protein [Paraflavitalea devenefica]NII29098.1 MgtC/SapB family protein [Paraflavitalea devenefica]
MENNLYLLLGLSLGLGLLVGLQREYASSKIAGIRTFPLITLTGTICGLLAKELDVWILVAGFLGVISLLVIGSIQQIKNKQEGGGITTEAAVLLMFSLGAYLVFGEPIVAVVLTGVITVLLHFKTSLHGLVNKIGEQDLRAVMQFVLISMVILPVLPNTTYDLYKVLNPRDIWLMVVLIVAISLCGYFAYKLFGDKVGALLGGVLGGLISSTATTVSYSKMAARNITAGKLAAFVIITASTISLVRVLIEIRIVSPSSFINLAFPLVAELAVMIVLTGILSFKQKKGVFKMQDQKNPAELKNAIMFGLLYAVISFLSAAANDKFGSEGLYVVSILSGLTDMDAITLSTAKMTEQKNIDASLGWRLILVAFLSNLVFKGGIAMIIGGKEFGKTIAFLCGIAILTGLAILYIWPF